MKSINFQRNKSLIRVVNEPANKRLKRNWDKLMYLILLGTVLFFIGYYFVNKVCYINAQGQVVIDGANIRLTDDARIFNYNVMDGDSVRIGDTLFCYAFNNKTTSASTGNDGSITLTTSESQDMWWYKEGYNLKKKITINKIEINKNKLLIDNFASEIKRLTNEAILDVLPKTRLEFAKNEIIRLNFQNEKLNSENIELEALTKTLRPFDETDTIRRQVIKGLNTFGTYTYFEGGLIDNFSGEILSELKYYKAPIDGVVTGVYTRNQETALKTENILSILKNYPARVKAFFKQGDLRHFKVNDVFSLKFPDGTTSKGVLKRFYVATDNLPDEFQKVSESKVRAIVADIYPLDTKEISRWRSFHQMSVDISKFKFN